MKDFEPAIEYSERLQQLTKFTENTVPEKLRKRRERHGLARIWGAYSAFREQKNSLALTRVLTDYEAALQLKSPKGLLVHGDVGTGKSMLIDLFADSLPNRKKRRWHFNTFMLEVVYRLDQLRKSQSIAFGPTQTSLGAQDYPLLKVAKDLIQHSPILFLDEFQMPDRTSSKILSTLLTSFFNLGGVLIATSNRMPNELAKASGMDMRPRLSGLESLKQKIGFSGIWRQQSDMFSGAGDFETFVQLLKARSDVWVMGSSVDYRRSEEDSEEYLAETDARSQGKSPSCINSLSIPNLHYASQSVETRPNPNLPRWYFLNPKPNDDDTPCIAYLNQASTWSSGHLEVDPNVVWEPVTLRVYGREIKVPHHHSGYTFWTFAELCQVTFGPADYTTLASSFHTFVIFNVPVLTWAQRNEARRFITLLDALYEARCKLMILAADKPDIIFFPDLDEDSKDPQRDANVDAMQSETFSEAYQDANTPFRPNISSYGSEASSTSSYESRPNTAHKASSPNFSLSGSFVGEDELFAYKRARSRIWEMCSKRWWDRQEDGWWRPLPAESRFWEKKEDAKEILEPKHNTQASNTEAGVESVTSSFRVLSEPPPKISPNHVWGATKWGKRAGAWGQGPEGLKDRKKEPRGQ